MSPLGSQSFGYTGIYRGRLCPKRSEAGKVEIPNSLVHTVRLTPKHSSSTAPLLHRSRVIVAFLSSWKVWLQNNEHRALKYHRDNYLISSSASIRHTTCGPHCSFLATLCAFSHVTSYESAAAAKHSARLRV